MYDVIRLKYNDVTLKKRSKKKRKTNPWFSVIDGETFQLNVEGFVAGKHWTYGI
jgi:hypothetical protein